MRVPTTKGKCYICGEKIIFDVEEGATLLRDALCPHCFASLRNSDVAHMLVKELCGKNSSIAEKKAQLMQFRILNTASYGAIHKALCDSPNYLCSEYFDDCPNGEQKNGVYCVDLCDIPFPDNSFDTIITEDVFEHILDYPQAFREIYRMLKPGGIHVFTVPVHEGRVSVSRKDNPKVVYHGDFLRDSGALVATDFGSDLPKILKDYGFTTRGKMLHSFFSPQEITDVDENYADYLTHVDSLERYFKYNSIVFVSKKRKAFSTWRKKKL